MYNFFANIVPTIPFPLMIARLQEINRARSVAFSGHRSFKIAEGMCSFEQTTARLCDELRALLNQGYNTFYTGMSEGFDLVAAECVMRLKSEFSDVRLVAVIPFASQSRRYTGCVAQSYSDVLAAADQRVILSGEYHAGCFHERNNYMIDNSSVLVCFYNGAAGGTKYTVERARRTGCEIINIEPDYVIEPQLSLAF